MTLRKLSWCITVLLLATAYSRGATAQPSSQPRQPTIAVWADGRRTSLPTPPGVKGYLVSRPTPAYPDEARRLRITGKGVYEVRIDKAGAVSGVLITKGAGSPLLDNAATAAMKKWRFKPGIFQKVYVPVEWAIAWPHG